MVNWHDPTILQNDYCESCGRLVGPYRIDSLLVTYIKLTHAIAGIYMYVYSHTQESEN
jgi:hypothetical protein